MKHRASTPQLTSDLDYWDIELTTGDVITVRAHAYSEREGAYVFVALMKGEPAYEYELLRVPAVVVDDVDGGWSLPRRADERNK